MDLVEVLHRDRGLSRALRLAFWRRSPQGSRQGSCQGSRKSTVVEISCQSCTGQFVLSFSVDDVLYHRDDGWSQTAVRRSRDSCLLLLRRSLSATSCESAESRLCQISHQHQTKPFDPTESQLQIYLPSHVTLTLTFDLWPPVPKVSYSCPCRVHQIKISKLSKYRIHKVGWQQMKERKNGRTDGRKNRQVDKIMPPPASLAWRRGNKKFVYR